MCLWGGGGEGVAVGQALSINDKGNLSSKILFNSYIVFCITYIDIKNIIQKVLAELFPTLYLETNIPFIFHLNLTSFFLNFIHDFCFVVVVII